MKKIIILLISIFILGSAIVSAASCAKEGKTYNNGMDSQGPFACCSGLKGFTGWIEGGQYQPLCYSKTKGIPVCKKVGTVKGRYYKDGKLLKKDESCKIVDIVKNSIFSDKELGVSFEYPKSWGTIKKQSETNKTKYLILLLKNGNTFLAFHNGDTPLARGTFWADAAMSINNSSYISNFCKDKISCKISTNKNGIQYVKYNEKYSEMGSNQIKRRLMYYIFNPNSNYRGIIMSNENIPNEPVANLDNIIKTLKFTVNESCKKEGGIEYQNTSDKQCCQGLSRFEYRAPSASSTPMCYDSSKGIPVCKKVGSVKGWYYNNGTLLKAHNDCISSNITDDMIYDYNHSVDEGYITQAYESGGKRYLKIDYVDFGEMGPGGNREIINNNPLIRTFEIDSNAIFYVLKHPDVAHQSIGWNEFKMRANNDWNTINNNIYNPIYFGCGKTSIVDIDHDTNKIYKITEEYRA